jgi:hypothetical protein
MKFEYKETDVINNHEIVEVVDAYKTAYNKQKGKDVRFYNPRVTLKCLGCGLVKTVNGTSVKRISCDSGPCNPNWIDMAGEVYGELTIIKPARLKHKQARNWGWECECTCGTIEVITRGSLMAGKVSCTKCMYKRISESRVLPEKKAQKNRILRQYKRNAGNRNYIWEISDDDAITLMGEPCSYCGAEPVEDNDGLVRNSLDRLDNAKGYIPGNIVAACFECNRMKHVMTRDEFVEHAERIVAYNKERSTASSKERTPKRVETERTLA